MSENHSAMKSAVRQPLLNSTRIAYITAFSAVSLLAYWWGAAGRSATAPPQEFTSTAVVHFQGTQAGPPAIAMRDNNSVRRQILAPG